MKSARRKHEKYLGFAKDGIKFNTHVKTKQKS